VDLVHHRLHTQKEKKRGVEMQKVTHTGGKRTNTKTNRKTDQREDEKTHEDRVVQRQVDIFLFRKIVIQITNLICCVEEKRRHGGEQ
jgi:hypothetical protein